MMQGQSVFTKKTFFSVMAFATWWTLIFWTLPFLYLWFEGWETFPHVNWLFDTILVISGIISLFATLAIYVAMWVYLFARDKDRIGSRVLWGIIIFFLGWYGSCLYFLLVYRRQFAAKSSVELRIDAPQLHADI